MLAVLLWYTGRKLIDKRCTQEEYTTTLDWINLDASKDVLEIVRGSVFIIVQVKESRVDSAE